jgi:EpsI family protein
LIVAAIIVGATYGAMHILQAGIASPPVEFPSWCHKDNDLKKEKSINLPYLLGTWSGQKADLDPEIFQVSGAEIAENRVYIDESNKAISLHLAMFSDVESGIMHSPMRCYHVNGWHSVAESKESLNVEQSPDAKVYFMKWDQEGKQCLVVYWYQLGNTILYDRLGLALARTALQGRSTWPPLVKVLIQTQVNSVSEEDKENLLDFSKKVYLWLNEDSHRPGFSPATPSKSSSEKSDAEKKMPKDAAKKD